MSSGVFNLLFFGVLNNVAGAKQIGESCLLPNNTPGICAPLFECRSAIRDLEQFRLPVYCNRNSLIRTVCCPENIEKPKPFPTLPPGWTQPDTDVPPFNYPPETHDRSSADSDSIVFDRLADRKCIEYSDYIYENRTIVHSDSSVSVERVDNCHFQFGPALVGGVKAGARQYPHMAIIGYGPDEANVQWLCGGSIISLSHVLTAAHCIETHRGTPTFVRVGDLNHKSSTDDAAPQTIAVLKSIPHDKYRTPYIYNDIGLLELVRNIEVTSHARPACLNTESTGFSMEPVVATGWGKTDFNGPSSPDLLEVNLEQFSSGQCEKSYPPSKQLPTGVNGDSQLCAGSRYEKKDTCQGDSGGPLQIKIENCMHKIVGVTSFGRGCGNIGVPGVYTRVSHYIDWIEEIAFSRG